MLLFDRSKKTGGFMDEIRCDEPSYLIWKWRPTGAQLGKGNRENAIRWGSSLRVKDGEVAVFVYSRCNETVQEYIEGPCDLILNTKNLPILASLVGLAYEGGTPFQAEVYFINLARIIQVKFGVPFFDIYDPRFTDFGVPVAVRGTVSFNIEDFRAFIKLHRLNNFQLEDFQQQIRDAVSRYVKDIVANAPATHNIPVIQIETKTAQINDMVEYDLAERLKENFGILVSGIDIGAIEIDKNSEGYHQLMAVTKNIATVRIEAETQDYMERLRIHREEEQYAAHKQTQTVNIGAFQVEKQADVGIAGAQALGQMGANGTGNVNLGDSADGFNMAAMMASMTIGSAVGRNIADAMNPITGSMGQSTPAGVTPPPIPPAAYYVAVNSKAIGPFELSVLAQMASSGQLTADSLVWKNGMSQWEKAKAVDELKGLFSVMPPIPEE